MNLIEQEWPPIDTPNWTTRKRIRGHIRRSLTTSRPSTAWRKDFEGEDVERAELKSKIKTWDSDGEGQPKYTLMIWYASVKAWRELAMISNTTSNHLLDV